jgi:hypothetical protein
MHRHWIIPRWFNRTLVWHLRKTVSTVEDMVQNMRGFKHNLLISTLVNIQIVWLCWLLNCIILQVDTNLSVEHVISIFRVKPEDRSSIFFRTVSSYLQNRQRHSAEDPNFNLSLLTVSELISLFRILLTKLCAERRARYWVTSMLHIR